MDKILFSDMQEVSAELLDIIGSFNEKELNRVPFEGSWTAAQVADHVLKYASGLSQVLCGKTKALSRQPDEKVAGIKAMFLDFSIKFKSPAFIVPDDKIFEQSFLLDGLKNAFETISGLIATQDQSVACPGFELPGFGELTRLELNYFILFHTQRHIHQLNNITAVIAGS